MNNNLFNACLHLYNTGDSNTRMLLRPIIKELYPINNRIATLSSAVQREELNNYINSRVANYIDNTGIEGAGFFDYVKNVFGNVEATTLTKYLKEYGSYSLKTITILRTPVQAVATGAIRVLNFGAKSEYDQLFHLFAVLELESHGKTVLLKIEKAPNILVEQVSELPKHQDSMIAEIKGFITFNRLIENTKLKYKKNEFYEYDARDNNCQRFIKSICHSAGITGLDEFIEQNVKSILQGHTHLIAKSVTNLGHFVNRLMGKGYEQYGSGIFDTARGSPQELMSNFTNALSRFKITRS